MTHAIKFMINIPDDMKKSGRSFTVIRLHNGVAEVLEDSDTDPDTITIESDRFSVYTLTYKDEIQNIPDTGERREWTYAVIMLMSGGVLLAMLRKKKRKTADI